MGEREIERVKEVKRKKVKDDVQNRILEEDKLRSLLYERDKLSKSALVCETAFERI